MILLKHFKSGYLCIALLLIFSGTLAACYKAPSGVRAKMREAYAETANLFNFVWSPAEFQDPKNEQAISKSLDRLINEFHDVAALSSVAAEEPGFRVTLSSHERTLKDIRSRFSAGQKEYANWRLRALTANCIACHSRYQAPVDFIGDAPSPNANSFEAELAAAEFLVATRQFEKADTALLRLANSVSLLPSGSAEAIQALKLWLVVEVRVKNRPAEAEKQLRELLETPERFGHYRASVVSWVEDLQTLAQNNYAGADPLNRAAELLRPIAGNTTLEEDESHLVTTLRATTLLHEYLQTKISDKNRREATFLLALAYRHLAIPSMELFQEMYLEQCIREFPGTIEAQKSYSVLQDLVEFQNSGSGGLHLEEKEAQKLKELRNLAFGTPRQMIPK
jgi:hypothetical protein